MPVCNVQYGLFLFFRWLTVKTANYDKVNMAGITTGWQSWETDVQIWLSEYLKTTVLDGTLWMGVHLIMLFPPLCSVCLHKQTDRQTDSTSHKDKQMESDVNMQTAALVFLSAEFSSSFFFLFNYVCLELN